MKNCDNKEKTSTPVVNGNFWRLVRNLRRGYYEKTAIRENLFDLNEGEKSSQLDTHSWNKHNQRGE